MYKSNTVLLRKTVLASAIAGAIGAGIPITSNSDIYVWTSGNSGDVVFTMLDRLGGAVLNSSTIRGQKSQTPTSGTMTYNTDTETGSATIAGFDFFSGTLPAEAQSIGINKIPTGLDDGQGNLILANMLFNWDGKNGIPVSLVWDAQGILGEMDGTASSFTVVDDGNGTGNPGSTSVSITTSNPFTGTGGIPASDGTFVGTDVTGGYLNLGPMPLATLSYNTQNVTGCVLGVDQNFDNNIGGGCMGINPSADSSLAIVVDTSTNNNDFDLNGTPTTGGYLPLANDGIGGNPMQDGPFQNFNANFEFTNMVLTSFTDTTPPTTAMNPHVTPAGTSPLTLTQGIDTYTEPGATCTDAAPLNTNLSASVVIGGDTVDTNTIGTYNVTYDCQDLSTNNATTITRIVNIVAPGVPSITLLGITPVTHECATAYTDAGATADDPEDGDISPSIIATPNDTVTLTLGIINEGAVSSQTIDYDVQDSGGTSAPTVTRTVNVVDTTNPSINLLGNNPDPVDSSTTENPATYTDPTADATDACDTVGFPRNISSSDTVNMVVPDVGTETLSYSLSYRATDTEGNIGIETRTVNVTRSQPVMTLSDGMGGLGGGLVLNVGDTYTEQGMDILDAQDLPASTLNVTASGTSSGLTYIIDSSTVDTSTAGNYTVTYDVIDSDGNNAAQVTRDVTVGVFASGSNFTMLDSVGNTFGGTNDVIFDWDETTNNDEVDYTNNLNFNMTIASQAPWPFFGFVWTAHHTRVFGPGTYSFDTGCTVAEIQATGCPAGSAANSGPAITMTVGPGQFGGHILFDWNISTDIDVVNVWDVDGVWDQHGDVDPKNQLWNGATGVAPDPTTDWKLVSTDANNDGINSSPMVDGPFQGFYANFNAGPGASAPPPEPYTGTAPDTKLGDSLFASPMNPWVLVTVFLSLLGLRRFNTKQ